MNALRAALRIFSGKKILNFGFQEKGLGPDKFRRLRQTRIKFPLIMAKANAAAI